MNMIPNCCAGNGAAVFVLEKFHKSPISDIIKKTGSVFRQPVLIG